MIAGPYLIGMASVAAVLSAVGYLFVARGDRSYMLASRWSYYMMTALVIAAAVYLVALFLGDRFAYSYVAGYSSSDLSPNFKITSFWAGQEGSFLLWVVFGVLLGLWVHSKARDLLGWVMFFYLAGQIFLFALLNVSSPFALNPSIPVDGQGLNPLLQNFWMQIHPPIVFLGYAAAFVPYSFAMAALASKKTDNWVNLAFPWAIFTVFTLGAGIFIGGYWAYETLGWGGYWGWDPVENASLVPWLASIALMHGMILERRRKAFRKTNLFLAITLFLMVIYGTFLTRSGVLADFSVHSFVDLGLSAYLVVFMLGFTVMSYGLLAARARGIKSVDPAKSPFTKEFATYLAILFLILSAFLVLLGTSSPLLTRLVGDPSAVDLSFYLITNLPIGIILGLVLGMVPLLSWGGSPSRELYRHLIIPVAIAALMVVVALILGVTNPVHLLFVFTSGFALAANLMLVISKAENGLRVVKSHFTHTGFALMLLGIVASSGYSSGEKISLVQGEPKAAAGFDLTFNGSERVSLNKQMAHVVVGRGADSFMASPIFLQSRQGLVRNPHIKKFLFYDLYISPEELKTLPAGNNSASALLTRGETKKIGDYEFTFEKFELGGHMETGSMTVVAELTVSSPGGERSTVKPEYIITGSKHDSPPATIPGSDKNVFLLKVNADERTITLGVATSDTPDQFEDKEVLILDVSRKPLINLVWLGLFMIVVGSGYSSIWRITRVDRRDPVGQKPDSGL